MKFGNELIFALSKSMGWAGFVVDEEDVVGNQQKHQLLSSDESGWCFC